MRKMVKKVFATVLALTMVLVMGTTALAADKVVKLWSDVVPNGTVTITGLKDTTSDNTIDGDVYVIDTNSTITYNRPLGNLEVFDAHDLSGTILTDVYTSNISKATRQDNEFWYDEESEIISIEYIKTGASLKFNKEGLYGIYTHLGYATREERISIQSDETYSWQYSPTLYVKVVASSSTSTTPTTPPVTNGITAAPTTSKVLVNGAAVEFDAYTINGNNYFKLRDVAKIISGSGKQFEVTWNGEKNTIELKSGLPYTVVGGEMVKGDGTAKNAVLNTSTVYKDGVVVELTAYTINGNNYFKLRDLGQSFDFNVSWDGANNCIVVDTTESYTAD